MRLRYLAIVPPLLCVAPAFAQTFTADRYAPDEVNAAPISEAIVEEMLRLANIDKEDLLYDLGSPDGRIVITAARRYGARAVVVDPDLARIADGHARARKAGVERQVRFIQGNPVNIDVGKASAVILDVAQSANGQRLLPKLLKELKPGTKIVSRTNGAGGWEPDETTTVDGSHIYAWIVPANVAGNWDLRASGAPGRKHYRVTLQQSYQRVKGTVGIEGKQAPIRTFHLSGNAVFFTFTDVVNGTPVMRQFRGEVDAGEMTGEPGQLEWSARRVPTGPDQH